MFDALKLAAPVVPPRKSRGFAGEQAAPACGAPVKSSWFVTAVGFRGLW